MKFDFEKCKNMLGVVIRYAVSGFAGIGANLAVFSFIVSHAKVPLWVPALLGFCTAYIVTFLLHKYWTFKSLSKELFYKQSIVYLFSAVIILILNTTVLYVLVLFLNLNAIFAQFTSLVLVAFLSFLFTSQVTFHRNESRIHAITDFSRFQFATFLKEQKLLLAILFIVMCATVFLKIIFFPLTFPSDAAQYVATSQLFLGDHSAIIYGSRILKPLAPGVTAVIAIVFGITPASALLVQAILFYFVLGFTALWFGWELFKKPYHALALSLFIVTSYPIFRYGLDNYTETGIWAIYFAVLALIVRWMTKPSFKSLFCISLLLLFGLLWKEYAVLVGLLFGLVIIFQEHFSRKQKIYALLQTAFIVLIPWGMWQYNVYIHYDYTYLNWLSVGSATSAYVSEYTPFKLLKTSFGLLFSIWALVVYGGLQWNTISPLVKKLLLLMALPSFGFLLWGYVSSRLFFSLVPFVVPFAVIGFMHIPNVRWKFFTVTSIIAVNFIFVVLAFNPDIRIFINHF